MTPCGANGWHGHVGATVMYIVLLTKTGPRCISFRCKITVSLAQGAVHDADADVADPVLVRSTVTMVSDGVVSEVACDGGA